MCEFMSIPLLIKHTMELRLRESVEMLSSTKADTHGVLG